MSDLAPAQPLDLALRVDPWAPEYDGSLQLVEAETEEVAPVDVTVERPRWGAVDPSPGPTPPLAIVDGVRRVELRVLTDVDGRTHYGLFGSAAVGAARLDARAEISDVRVARFLVMGGGLVAGDAVVEPGHRRQSSSASATTTPAGRPRQAADRSGTVLVDASSRGSSRTTDGRDGTLRFTGIAVAENTAMAPLTGLQEQMRAAEAALAERLAGQAGDVVIVDGPLQPLRPPSGLIVGYVKRMLRSYLGPAEAALLGRLGRGQRTPVFAILDRHPRYSWYVRLAPPAAVAHGFAGVARLEISQTTGLAEAVRVADLTARVLPRLASTPERDPRAPQNLVPVGALERHLRHRLGDPTWIRRLLLTWLSERTR